jgi:long-chain acyl-CoA synthetase
VGQNIAIVAERNKEMSNRILERWEHVLSARSGDAVYSPSGGCLRTWSDIESEANDFEKHLCGSGGGVALQTGNHPSFPALLIACLRARRAVSLFDADFFGEARARIEGHLGVATRVVVFGGELRFEDGHGRAGGESGACLYKLTSGTTTLPQAIGFTASQLVADCDQVCGTMGIGGGDLNYGVIAMSHSYGFSNLATPLLCRGVRLVVATDPLPRAIEQGLRSTGATVLAAVPAMFRGLLAAGPLPESLRLCISAGSLLDPVLAREFFQKFGRKIHSFYGASECGGICYDSSEELPESPGFVGEPLDGVDIEIADDPEGARILIRSEAVGIGMAGAAGGFQPTDLLVRAAGGFRIVGRDSELINVAGRKVNPVEIEQVLVQFPGVSEAVVCGVDDPARGQEICALIAAKVSPDMLLLRHHCATQIAPWKVPRRFALVPDIPRNARGKTSRSEIARSFF